MKYNNAREDNTKKQLYFAAICKFFASASFTSVINNFADIIFGIVSEKIHNHQMIVVCNQFFPTKIKRNNNLSRNKNRFSVSSQFDLKNV